jgi:protein phosphatase 1 regulatory subunit 42
MIKNIPNKYTQRMLLQTLDSAKFKGLYDFLYLPIDFKNRCNVGYAFINFRSYQTILRLADKFAGKKWERFNSEKICQLAYARI